MSTGIDNLRYTSDLESILRRFTAISNNPALKIKICTEVQHLCWLGGEPVVNQLLEEAKFLQFLCATLQPNPHTKTDPELLQLQAIQCVTVLCRVSENAQKRFVELGALRTLVALVCSEEESNEMRKWATSALFWMIATNTNHQSQAAEFPDLMNALEEVGRQEVWYHMTRNDANQLVKLLRLL